MTGLRSLAVSLVALGIFGTTAAANGFSTDFQNLWQYWSARETGVSSLSFPFTTTPIRFPSPARMQVAPRFNAFVNLEGQSYPDAFGLLNVGTIRPWYTSPAFTRFHGGQIPDAEVRREFARDVVTKVRDTFERSGLGDVRITDDPNALADHTLSVVSGASYDGSSDILGMTYTGGSGFSFVDNFNAPQIDSVDKLETALAKNIAHELMHAFGGDHHGIESPYLDAAQTTWDKLTNEASVFSAEASQNIRSLLDGTKSIAMLGVAAGERVLRAHRVDCPCTDCCPLSLAPQPIPEPSTFVIGLASVVVLGIWRRRARMA